MEITKLNDDRVKEFIEYCKLHRKDVDDSFLYDEDLEAFKPDNNNPTYIVIDEKDKIVAAASLILNDYNRRSKKGRFRIFYSEIDSVDVYDMLLNKILLHTQDMEMIYVFIPTINDKHINYIKNLKFNIYRYSLLLVREVSEWLTYDLPQKYSIKPFKKGDEEIWCNIRNLSFQHLLGSETPITPDIVSDMMNNSEENIEGGSLILYYGDKPVGIVRGTKNELDDKPIMDIGPLAIIPEYQGRGLGRCMLRAAINFAKSKNYDKVDLCVNSENENAKKLYIQEGFKQFEEVVCYKFDL